MNSSTGTSITMSSVPVVAAKRSVSKKVEAVVAPVVAAAPAPVAAVAPVAAQEKAAAKPRATKAPVAAAP